MEYTRKAVVRHESFGRFTVYDVANGTMHLNKDGEWSDGPVCFFEREADALCALYAWQEAEAALLHNSVVFAGIGI